MKIFSPKKRNSKLKGNWMKTVSKRKIKPKSPQPKFSPKFLGFEKQKAVIKDKK